MEHSQPTFDVVEAEIPELRSALDAGVISSVELVAAYLDRVGFYDRHGIRLNSLPVLNPDAFAEAEASDQRRARGETLGPLDGIPYTAKNSYMVKGLTVAAGSPAFEHLVAQHDAFTIERLRQSGAILLGLTNMPPMANGGMQRGVYGRAESPYNGHFLTSAYVSGSSNGSGTATAASFAAFGLGEETWSSGRAPASCNGLVAYTPSWGVISLRGNWPLVPTMDVVVPHTRTMTDMLEVLDVIVADDREQRGDFWRVQQHVEVPHTSRVRPEHYRSLATTSALAGKRLGIPKMYINRDPESANPIQTRASVIELWRQAAHDLRCLGAEIIEVDFPVVSRYEKDRPGAFSMVDCGLVPPEFAEAELWTLSIFAWDDFLSANGDPALHRLADVDGAKIFPLAPGSLPDRYEGDPETERYVEAAADGVTAPADIPFLGEGLRGLAATRKSDFEDWMDGLGLDAVVFPTLADVAPSDADYNPHSNDIAWRNGTGVANGNLVIRHLGIPTVTVPMGVMPDTAMPVGLTFAGRAYDDNLLLGYGFAFEASGQRRITPPRTPALPPAPASPIREVSENTQPDSITPAEPESPEVRFLDVSATLSPVSDQGTVTITVQGTCARLPRRVRVRVNGEESAVTVKADGHFEAEAVLPMSTHYAFHSHWRRPYGSLITVVATLSSGRNLGRLLVVGGQE